MKITIPLIVYNIILFWLPTPAGLEFIYIVIGITMVLLYFSHLLPEWLRGPAGLTLVLVLFGYTLLRIWSTSESNPDLIGGLLQFSDANGYYYDARRLLEGGLFSVFSGRRPLFAALLTVLLGITSQNLQISLAILVAINAITGYFLFREIEHTHGSAVATMVLLLFYLFYRRFIDSTLTENLGLALGALGFTLLWRGTGQRQKSPILFGLFLLTLALNARSGAYLILPALVLWFAWFFRDENRLSWKCLIVAGAVVIIAFGINLFLLKQLAVAESIPNSNYSFSFYGLAVGGKGWTQIMVDHPEVMSMNLTDQTNTIFKLAIQSIQSIHGA